MKLCHPTLCSNARHKKGIAWSYQGPYVWKWYFTLHQRSCYLLSACKEGSKPALQTLLCPSSKDQMQENGQQAAQGPVEGSLYPLSISVAQRTNLLLAHPCNILWLISVSFQQRGSGSMQRSPEAFTWTSTEAGRSGIGNLVPSVKTLLLSALSENNVQISKQSISNKNETMSRFTKYPAYNHLNNLEPYVSCNCDIGCGLQKL